VLLAVWLLAVRLGAGSGWSPRLLASALPTPSRQVPLLAVTITALVLSRTGRQRILFLTVLLVAAAPWTWLGRRELHDGRWTAIPTPATTNAVYACFWTNRLGPAGLPGPGDTAGLSEVGAYLSGVDDPVLREAGRTMTADPQEALRLRCAAPGHRLPGLVVGVHASRSSPCAVTSPEPESRTRSPVTSTRIRLGRPRRCPCSMRTGVPSGTRPERTRATASGPAAVPVAGSSAIPTVGLKKRVYASAPSSPAVVYR
jgi:hypothetical protein